MIHSRVSQITLNSCAGTYLPNRVKKQQHKTPIVYETQQFYKKEQLESCIYIYVYKML